MPQVKVPPPYRGLTRGEVVIEVEGATVRECIQAVDAQYPGFGEKVFGPEGNVYRFVTLFVNGDEVRRDDVDVPVGSGDEVEILAAIAGG
jgi:molybdopterin synthase sulfur carrier subunit